MKRRLICLGISTWLVTLAAFAQDKSYVENFSCERPPYGLRLPGSARDFPKIGRIKSDVTTDHEDWEDYKTFWRSIEYDGFRLDVITFSNDADRYLVASAVLTTKKWKIAGPFRVRQHLNDVRRILQAQDKSLDSKLSFGSEGGSLTFEQGKDGKVTQISYECYIG